MHFDENRSIYEQIVDYVYRQVLTGVWPAGERLPSVRELAVQMEVNPNTVQRSYSQLQDRGIIYNQRGIGYFVAEGAVEQARSEKRKEFEEQELPRLFQTMVMLGITLEDLKELWQRFIAGAGDSAFQEGQS